MTQWIKGICTYALNRGSIAAIHIKVNTHHSACTPNYKIKIHQVQHGDNMSDPSNWKAGKKTFFGSAWSTWNPASRSQNCTEDTKVEERIYTHALVSFLSRVSLSLSKEQLWLCDFPTSTSTVMGLQVCVPTLIPTFFIIPGCVHICLARNTNK